MIQFKKKLFLQKEVFVLSTYYNSYKAGIDIIGRPLVMFFNMLDCSSLLYIIYRENNKILTKKSN